MGAYPFADLALARRLEHTEALASSRSIEARARVSPERGACWIAVAAARAMFDGPTSPLTQTFGLGMSGAVTTADLDAIEAFFQERGAPIFHEVSPLADPSLVMLLNDRGYHQWSYSNTGFNLAAIIVSRVSGMPFADFTRERLFKPLGMTHTSWRDDFTRIVKGRAFAYAERGAFHTAMPFENVYGTAGCSPLLAIC